MTGTEGLPRARALTDYHNRGTEWPYGYANQHILPQYQPPNGFSCISNSHQVQYSPVNSTYSSYSPTYYSAASQGAIHWPSTNAIAAQYSVRPPPRSATVPSQPRIQSRSGYYGSTSHNQRPPHLSLRSNVPLDFILMDTEDQDSCNRETMLSEPIEPALSGYPKVEDFDDLMKNYVSHLSPKKQDKALIHARRAANIKTVLADKKTTSVESAQFRFWVKKMFQLQPSDSSVPLSRKKICHEGKPVAIREKLFKILTRAHQKCQHGGRDKTSAQVRRVYSWVPKELISRFVKLCPTCQIRRGQSRGLDTKEDSPSPTSIDEDTAIGAGSPVKSRQTSSAKARESNTMDLPLELINSTSAFHNQNRWLSGFPPPSTGYETLYSPTTPIGNTASFSVVNGSAQYSQHSSVQPSPLGTISNISPSHSRPVSSHEPRYKQEIEYCYN